MNTSRIKSGNRLWNQETNNQNRGGDKGQGVHELQSCLLSVIPAKAGIGGLPAWADITDASGYGFPLLRD